MSFALLLALSTVAPAPVAAKWNAFSPGYCSSEERRKHFLSQQRDRLGFLESSQARAEARTAELERLVDRLAAKAGLDAAAKEQLQLDLLKTPDVTLAYRNLVALAEEIASSISAASRSGDDRTLCLAFIHAQSRTSEFEALGRKASTAYRKALEAWAKARGVSQAP